MRLFFYGTCSGTDQLVFYRQCNVPYNMHGAGKNSDEKHFSLQKTGLWKSASTNGDHIRDQHSR
jgi:hypothetical protein